MNLLVTLSKIINSKLKISRNKPLKKQPDMSMISSFTSLMLSYHSFILLACPEKVHVIDERSIAGRD
jgi:hypothetical protein